MDLLEGITGFEDSVRKCKFLSELGLPEGREWQQVLRVALRLCPSFLQLSAMSWASRINTSIAGCWLRCSGI